VEHIHQREIYMPDSAFTRQPTVAAMMRLEKAAMNWPRTEVLVIDPLTDYLELPWNFYALKDTPLHAYHSASLNARIPGGEAWALNNRLPQHIMVRPDTANGAPLFATPEFAIVNLRSKVYVEHVETPNGSEQWATSWETNRSPSHC
jgi:hypothetical protein